MGSESPPKLKPSFSPWRKWSIGLNVVFIVLVVLSVVVMVNYLSRDYSKRFYLSSQVKRGLSPQTLKFIESVTNRIKVVLYYDHNEPFYSTVVSLLNEYKFANPKISIEEVDYLRDAGRAQTVKALYKLTFPSATNVIIFDCEGRRPFPIDGNLLTSYALEEIPNEKEREYRKRPVEFNGERIFTAALLAVTSTNQPHAYFLEGDGEHSSMSGDDTYGYSQFAGLLRQSWVQPQALTLEGTNTVPMDGLLIIAGPQYALPEPALRKIDDYLAQGGRLFVLFNFLTTNKETGLEKLLAKWGLEVGRTVIKDEVTYSGSDIIVTLTNRHPVVNSLMTLRLQMIEPRSVGKLRSPNVSAEAPQVEEVAFSGPAAFPKDDRRSRRAWPLIAVVEKGAIKGVITERGATRIVAVGDSFFLANQAIMAGAGANGDFGKCAVNWLLARTQLLEGIGPQRVHQYRILMSAKQLQNAEWILVAGMPGAVLLLGGLVWLRRRK